MAQLFAGLASTLQHHAAPGVATSLGAFNTCTHSHCCRELPALRAQVKQLQVEQERLTEKIEHAAATAAGVHPQHGLSCARISQPRTFSGTLPVSCATATTATAAAALPGAAAYRDVCIALRQEHDREVAISQQLQVCAPCACRCVHPVPLQQVGSVGTRLKRNAVCTCTHVCFLKSHRRSKPHWSGQRQCSSAV
jgi:hypothetical protein